MHEDVQWQVFGDDGMPIEGKGGHRKDFEENPSYRVGAANIWMWRLSEEGVEVLLQKRAATKHTWPSHYDISASGHIDLGENPVQSAIREAKEEIDVDIDPSRLYFVQAIRTPLDKQEIDFVYTYQLTSDDNFAFGDGEVESVEWWSLEAFRYAAMHPDKHQMVPQGDRYFAGVIESLQQQTQI
jgi:isopentenyldiphosphate isomerase